MNAWPKENEPWTAGQRLLVLLAFLVVGLMGIHTIAHSDFWTHLAVGRWIAVSGIPRTDTLSFTRTGQPWINASWLYDRALFALWNVTGAKGLILLHAIVMIGAFAALVPVMKKWAGGLSISLAVLLGVWLVAPRYQVGPHLLALLLVTLFLNLLSSRFAPWKLVSMVALQVLWANVDPSFLLGPAIGAVFAIEAFTRRAENRGKEGWPFGAVMAVTVGCLIATLVNPYHIRVWQVVSIPVVRQPPAAREWISPFAALFPASVFSKGLITVALIIGAGGLLAEKRRLPLAITTLAVVSAFSAVVSVYHVSIFGILSLPFMALSLEAIGAAVAAFLERIAPALREWGERLVAGLVVLVTVGALSALFTNTWYVSTGSASTSGFGVVHNMFPAGAIDLISKNAFSAPLFHLPTDGGYLMWRVPERQVFCDTRVGVYDSKLFELGTQCLAGQSDAWKQVDEKWGIAVALLNCTSPSAAQAARSLLASKTWLLAFFDGTTAVLVRDQQSVANVLGDAKAREVGLQALERERQTYARALGSRIRPANSAPLIGAGNFYMALGRYKEAAAVYELLTRGAPEMAAAWVNLGMARLQLGQLKQAEAALARATRAAPKNIVAWLQLSEVYARLNDREGERAALQRARRINEAQTRAFVESRGRQVN